MTTNKITKKDLFEMFPDDIYDSLNSLDETARVIKRLIENEVRVSLPIFKTGEMEDVLISRNIICAINALNLLEDGEFHSAWNEIWDILSFKKENEYITKSEISLIYILLTLFVTRMDKYIRGITNE